MCLLQRRRSLPANNLLERLIKTQGLPVTNCLMSYFAAAPYLTVNTQKKESFYLHQSHLGPNTDCKPITVFFSAKLKKRPEEDWGRGRGGGSHLPRKEQQATPDFITDSMMQLATMVVQLWFCLLY